MNQKIIGKGTWYDKMASKVINREMMLDRNLDNIRTEMGLGASGFPHIGSLGDAARSYAIALALKNFGYNSEMIAFCDDKDGLRKVPSGLPKSLKKYLGYPVSDIPDPFGCHESYGEHMSSLLLESLDISGIKYLYFSAKNVYEKGLLINEIREILLNAKQVGKIVKEEVGQERYINVLPYFPVCKNCGRLYTAKALEFIPSEDKVLYVCEGMEIKGKWIEGCGFKGEVDVRKGEGKLSWKGEFAARWRALEIKFEPYGKDIADSVRINDRICREILHYEPPVHAKYEMFLDKSGRKISKSTGNVFTPQIWFRYGSPQSLLLLMLKRFTGTRTLHVKDIPVYMNELDNLEDIFFGLKIIKDEKELAKLKGLYEYCWLLSPPIKPKLHIPYNLLTFIVKLAPAKNAEIFILGLLQKYGYIKKDYQIDESLKNRINFAFNWINEFEDISETKVNLLEEEKMAIKKLIQSLEIENNPEKIQNIIFQTAKNFNLKPRVFFKILYNLLIGVSQGPRLGPYILAMGKQNVINSLKRSI